MIPESRKMRTPALAALYLAQGNCREAEMVYSELAAENPQDAALARGLAEARRRVRHESLEALLCQWARLVIQQTELDRWNRCRIVSKT